MYHQLTNSKGDKLFILTVVSTNDIQPMIRVDTWEKCLDLFNSHTTEQDTERFFAQLIHKDIKEGNVEASMRCNRKGWGFDYFKYLTIKPLYITE